MSSLGRRGMDYGVCDSDYDELNNWPSLISLSLDEQANYLR